MSAAATLTIAAAPQHGPAARAIVVDCAHGTSTAVLMAGGPPEVVAAHERASVALAIAKHFSEERCRCTAKLRRRYGLAEAKR